MPSHKCYIRVSLINLEPFPPLHINTNGDAKRRPSRNMLQLKVLLLKVINFKFLVKGMPAIANPKMWKYESFFQKGFSRSKIPIWIC